jgi:hypothetical protein
MGRLRTTARSQTCRATSPAATVDSSRLSKDQLPALGLTVNVASAAAMAAAQINAANQAAAAAAAAAKSRPASLAGDGCLCGSNASLPPP